ncbi:hypothetical protein GDO81_011803 [Engystomops pustulosus]|uniref:CAP N-terminal domain-containing protein n=1 Tax=Engystomops pustulosus TaxID=76066 RepID=A0AAV7BGW9_ENGPU|nr:hypothetical protein GDO81_011803 [Engystomops pustulosus]
MAESHGLMERLEKAVIRLETVLSASCFSKSTGNDIVNGINGGIAAYVEAFDTLMTGTLEQYLKNSKILGGDVETHATLVENAFKAERVFLAYASQHQQPPEFNLCFISR